MKACPATTTRAVRSLFSPRIGLSRALRRPWSVSRGLFAWAQRGVRPGAAAAARRHLYGVIRTTEPRPLVAGAMLQFET
jgi:hypothetical protein